MTREGLEVPAQLLGSPGGEKLKVKEFAEVSAGRQEARTVRSGGH